MGYKFSWAPRGVILAGKNSARFLKDGVVVNVPGPELFDHYEFKTVPGVGVFENYPNRDSLPYAEIYGIADSLSIYRGTLRFPGWCETLKVIVELGYMDETVREDIGGNTYAQVLRDFLTGKGDPAGSPHFQAKPVGLGFSSEDTPDGSHFIPAHQIDAPEPVDFPWKSKAEHNLLCGTKCPPSATKPTGSPDFQAEPVRLGFSRAADSPMCITVPHLGHSPCIFSRQSQ